MNSNPFLTHKLISITELFNTNKKIRINCILFIYHDIPCDVNKQLCAEMSYEIEGSLYTEKEVENICRFTDIGNTCLIK